MIQAYMSGRLTKDPETKRAKSDTDYTVVTLAVPTGKGDEVHFVRLMAFGNVSPLLSRFRKGDAVTADGELEVGLWERDDGPAVGLQMKAAGVAGARRTSRPSAKKRKPNRKQAAQRTMDAQFNRGSN